MRQAATDAGPCPLGREKQLFAAGLVVAQADPFGETLVAFSSGIVG
jgi:hypothetical protein